MSTESLAKAGLYKNTSTFPLLRDGYSAKFGPATQQRRIPISNRFGGRAYQDKHIWEDAQENRLTILSAGLFEDIEQFRTIGDQKRAILTNGGEIDLEVGWLIIE